MWTLRSLSVLSPITLKPPWGTSRTRICAVLAKRSTGFPLGPCAVAPSDNVVHLLAGVCVQHSGAARSLFKDTDNDFHVRTRRITLASSVNLPVWACAEGSGASTRAEALAQVSTCDSRDGDSRAQHRVCGQQPRRDDTRGRCGHNRGGRRPTRRFRRLKRWIPTERPALKHER